MLLNFQNLCKKYSLKIEGAIIVGANTGQEHKDYVSADIKRFVYIEPCAAAFNVLKNKFAAHHHIQLFNVACGDFDGEQIMYTGSQNEGQSNSLLKMDKHTQIHPGITLPTTELVKVVQLDNLGLAHKGYQLLVLDVQGYEGHVLRGASKTLEQINYIYSEVNRDTVYKNCTLIGELDNILHEFERVETGEWIGGMWSDSLYIRKTLIMGKS